MSLQLMVRLASAEELREQGGFAIHETLMTTGARKMFQQFAREINAVARDGDELWTWQPSEFCAAWECLGLALVRAGGVVQTWPLPIPADDN
jgi:hypothetical protein